MTDLLNQLSEMREQRDRLEQEKRSAWRHAREMESDWARERDRAEIAEEERDRAREALEHIRGAGCANSPVILREVLWGLGEAADGDTAWQQAVEQHQAENDGA